AELDYAREKGLSEGRKEGRKEGMAQGIAEGMEKSMELVAVNMIKNKMDIELIVKITGLSKTKILKLKQTVYDRN
ncbi:MAG: hypothetical protein OXK80_01075, partial [Bdellovibrionales bacterium]|nr:hypothetical protein [Bdellovibrionales bacterium]